MQLLDKPGGYLEITKSLLDERGVDGPQDAVEVLAKRIMFVHTGVAQKTRSRTTTPRLTASADSARRHVEALLRYKVKPPSRYQSVYNRQRKLRSALEDIELVVALELATPSTNVSSIIRAIAADELSPRKLENLRSSLATILAEPRSRTGRPRDYISTIVVSAVNVWLKAGKEIDRGYNCGKFAGAFPNFLLDIFRKCGIPELNGNELDALNQRLSPKEIAKITALPSSKIHSK